jgi:2-haloacid dehalogenase
MGRFPTVRERAGKCCFMDFSHFEWVSFDCYGTLVDWETGISSAVARVMAAHEVRRSRAEILALFAESEPKVQTSPGFMEYRRVLRGVMKLIADGTGVELAESDLTCLADSLPDWPVFPDVADALHTLKRQFKLAIVSNVDDDLFVGTARHLGVEFDAVVTSQQARSYKPNPANFTLAQERMGVRRENWLHVAESLHHDVGPANALGITSVWVNRADRGGGTRRTGASPDLVVPGLAELAEMARSECG